MKLDQNILSFLGNYDEKIVSRILKLREVVLSNLPEIIEQLDLPARMIAYSYGAKKRDLICVIIPSKKGVKLGFNRGVELSGSHGLLKGNGKISRYVEIDSDELVNSKDIKELIDNALILYHNINK